MPVILPAPGIIGTLGSDLVNSALRELQVIDPTAVANAEQLADGLMNGSDLLDTWRVDRITITGVTIGAYHLVANQQSYTIGPGGNFDQDYPQSIESWSLVLDTTASYPVEIPMGRPYTSDQWQQIRIKTLTNSRPQALYFDRAYSGGLGNVLIYPIPDRSTIDVRLYMAVAFTGRLEAGTTYYFPPGVVRALKLNLALELSDGYGRAAVVTPRLERRAALALGSLKRSNIVPRESLVRSDFVIGSSVGRRTHNVYSDSG